VSLTPKENLVIILLCLLGMVAIIAAAAVYQCADRTHLTPPAERGPDGRWR
jgi:hypothetical protein